MNYEIILYVVFTFISAFAISGVNFGGIIKKGKILEARVLVIILSLSLGYLLTNFVIAFIK